MKVKLLNCSVPGIYYFYCPGCKQDHQVHTIVKNERGAMWSYNNVPEKPSFSPSIHIWADTEKGRQTICHSFVENGMIKYLPDCAHELKGQTIELPEYE